MNIQLTVNQLEYFAEGEYFSRMQPKPPELKGRYRSNNILFLDCPDRDTASFWVQFQKVKMSGFGPGVPKKSYSPWAQFSSSLFMMEAETFSKANFEIKAALLGSVDLTLAYEITQKIDWPWKQ
jgi:hypothetical protein